MTLFSRLPLPFSPDNDPVRQSVTYDVLGDNGVTTVPDVHTSPLVPCDSVVWKKRIEKQAN